MIDALLVTALLTVVDPPGDTFGDGSLQPPTAAVYRSLAPLDLRAVTVLEGDTLEVAVELGSIANPFDLPLGISLPVIEVYLDYGPGGHPALLPGSGMSLPAGREWDVALRVTGERAQAFRVSGGEVEEATPRVTIDGNVLRLSTPFATPDRPRVYAAVGLFDPFGPDDWRPLEGSPSPWAFAAEGQRFPVVDLLAPDPAAQATALEQGILPGPRERGALPGAGWFVVMGIGVVLAAVGLILRFFVRDPADAPSGADPSGPEAWVDDGATFPQGHAGLERAGAPAWEDAADEVERPPRSRPEFPGQEDSAEGAGEGEAALAPPAEATAVDREAGPASFPAAYAEGSRTSAQTAAENRDPGAEGGWQYGDFAWPGEVHDAESQPDGEDESAGHRHVFSWDESALLTAPEDADFDPSGFGSPSDTADDGYVWRRPWAAERETQTAEAGAEEAPAPPGGEGTDEVEVVMDGDALEPRVNTEVLPRGGTEDDADGGEREASPSDTGNALRR